METFVQFLGAVTILAGLLLGLDYVIYKKENDYES